MNVGDKVRYVPDTCHATTPDASGELPWQLGNRERGTGPRGRKDGGELKPLDEQEALKRVRRAKRSRQALGAVGVEPMHPKRTWDAVVTAVNADGTVDITVTGCKRGVELECRRVKVDPTGKIPHTVHDTKHHREEQGGASQVAPPAPVEPPTEAQVETSGRRRGSQH